MFIQILLSDVHPQWPGVCVCVCVCVCVWGGREDVCRGNMNKYMMNEGCMERKRVNGCCLENEKMQQTSLQSAGKAGKSWAEKREKSCPTEE